MATVQKYSDLSVLQKIALKGWMKEKASRPAFFRTDEHNYFDALYSLWIVSDFREAINNFLNNNH